MQDSAQPAGDIRIDAAPVAGQERIHLIDALRGFALFGVLTANIWLWFSGTFLLFPAYQYELQRLSADSVSYHLINVLISGKFISIFSFLFGLGFAIQLQRAQARGDTVTGIYIRRLLVLMAFGAAHGFLLWYGDVLLSYSLLGFVLLAFARRRRRTVLIWAVILIVGWPLLGALMASATAPGAGVEEQFAAVTTPARTAFSQGGYSDIIQGNIIMLGMFWGGQYLMFLPYVLGVFLLGMLIGRAGILADPAPFVARLRTLRLAVLPLAIAANGAVLYLALSYSMVELMSKPSWLAVQIMLFPLSLPTLAAVYVTTLVLAHHQSPIWRHRLELLAPAGRMALSNYLSHSFICVGLYYGIGLGLMDRLTPVSTLPVAVLIFAIQVVWSRWWLARFRFGPAEWLWRTLTYGQPQPMRRS